MNGVKSKGANVKGCLISGVYKVLVYSVVHHHPTFYRILHQGIESQFFSIDAFSVVQVEQARGNARVVKVDSEGHVVGPRLLGGEPREMGGQDRSSSHM